MISEKLASLFQTDPSAPAQIALRQGVVQSWDADTGENSIQIAGGTIVNIPSLTAESAELIAGDVVAVLSSGDQALVLGKVTTPGDPGTVPTWNADLTALAPLVDLAAVTTGTTITGATNVSTPDANGAHVVVNDPAYPGQIALYSGNANENAPALIRPILGGANFGQLELRSPDLASGGYAYLLLEGYDDGHANMTGFADNFRFEGDNLTLTGFTLVKIGDGSDWISIVGNAVTDADLSSLTNTFPTFPYYYGYLSASPAAFAAGNITLTGWVDDGSPNSSEIADPASGIVTVPRAGRYRVTEQTWWPGLAASTGTRTTQIVQVSPNVVLASHTVAGSATATTPTPNRIDKTVRLAAGAQIFVRVSHTSTNSTAPTGSGADITYFQVEWVGP